MKNKKGFTLVELLAVIVVLSIIIGIIIVKALDLSNNRRSQDFENIKRIITESTKTAIESDYYLSDSLDAVIGNGGSCKLSYSFLVNNNYMDSDIKNPTNNNDLNGYVIITMNTTTYKYSYEYKETLTSTETQLPNCM